MSDIYEAKKMQIEPCLGRENKMAKAVAIAEIKLVMRMLAQNHSFNSMPRIAKFNASIYTDSAIAKKVTCGRGVAVFLVQESYQILVQQMRQTRFSLIVNETTDMSTTKYLVLIVRQFDMETGKSTECLFRLVESENSQIITLYNSIIASLKENDISIYNFFGFASDNAATMVGRKSGVVTLLKNNIPNIFHIGCMCHTVALMNNAALVHVPKDVEELCKNIYN